MMLVKKLLTVSLVGALASMTASADTTLSGNVTFVSDYVFRGVSQTVEEAAVQGTLEAAVGNGVYIGLFGSNVSALSYNNGNLETDLYLGWRKEVAEGMTMDVGAISYLYPHAETATTHANDYDTTEIYIGLSQSWWSFKYSYAVTDFFGINDDNVPAHLDTAVAAGEGDSKGASYVEFNANWTLVENVSLQVHAGHQSVANYDELNYSDARVALNWMARPQDNLTLGLSFSTTDAEEGYYTVVDGNSRVEIASDRWAVTLIKAF